jgi:hypothetical protein
VKTCFVSRCHPRDPGTSGAGRDALIRGERKLRSRLTGRTLANDMIPERRAITPDEAEVIRAALERASVLRIDDAAMMAVPALTVVAACECGCASVDFDAPSCEERSTLVADATARTSRGGQVGVMVWGRPDAITGLEIYDLGAGEDDLGLPVSASIIAWDRSEAG